MTTIITRAGKGSPLTNTEMDTNLTNLNTDKLETVNPSASGTLTHSGDVVLSGSGKRITGDFSNATVANRLMFQTSTVSGNTNIHAIPATGGVSSSFEASTAPIGSAASVAKLFSLGTDVRLAANVRDGGTFLPMTFYTGGSERMRIGTDGQLGIAGPNYGTAGQVLTSNGGATAPSWGAPSGVPSGTVAHFAMNSAPSGWIKANGAAVSRTVYAELFAAIGTTYGVGNGSTTFNVPDLRGEFLRGLDDGRGVDTGRAIGSAQAGQNLSHNHGANVGAAGSHSHATQFYSASGSPGAYPVGIGLQTPESNGPNVASSAAPNHQHSISSDGGTEARPRNVAMLACIKY